MSENFEKPDNFPKNNDQGLIKPLKRPTLDLSGIQFDQPQEGQITFDVESSRKSQVEIWVERARDQGYLTEVGMNQAATSKITGEHVFLTQGFNGCISILKVDDTGEATFEHIDAKVAQSRLEELQSLVESDNTLILKPDIPELDSLEGDTVSTYHLNLNPHLDNFAEGMTLQESPYSNSVCFHVSQVEDGYEVYLNAFERSNNAKWQVDTIPPQVAKKFEVRNQS